MTWIHHCSAIQKSFTALESPVLHLVLPPSGPPLTTELITSHMAFAFVFLQGFSRSLSSGLSRPAMPHHSTYLESSSVGSWVRAVSRLHMSVDCFILKTNSSWNWLMSAHFSG